MTLDSGDDYTNVGPDRVYYRILTSLKDGSPCVVTMQWLDEYDYDQSRFLTEEKFDTEATAWDWLYLQIGKSIALLRSVGVV